MTNVFRISVMITLLALLAGLGETVAHADPILPLPPSLTLSGSTTSSFDGGPFGSSTSFHGITFEGSAFTLRRPLIENYQRFLELENGDNMGTMSWNGSLTGLSVDDIFTLRLTFDSAAAANPGYLDVSWRILHLSSEVISFQVVVPWPTNPTGYPISFTSGIYNVNGGLYVAGPALNIHTQPDVLDIAFVDVASYSPGFTPNIPEPTTMVLLCSGLVGLAVKLRSRRR